MGLLRQRRKSKKKSDQVKPQVQEEGCTTALWELRRPIGPEFCEETIPADGCEEGHKEEAEVPQTSGETAHSHHGHSHNASGGGIADIVWMVLLGDGIHNFTDGLAIGAVYDQTMSLYGQTQPSHSTQQGHIYKIISAQVTGRIV
ncbi:unnamed protein product [Ranitomeya imitator]|uniref:Uncharacterized protein n=1 Tax=Ranitomeya imitator TaxID=111125 RepID=A0ABN9LGX8_9NEOB|nr:unnamed protein product [Ranitomeya imitator]